MERLFIVGRPNLGRQANFYSLSHVTCALYLVSFSHDCSANERIKENVQNVPKRDSFGESFYSLTFLMLALFLFILSRSCSAKERSKENVQNVQKSDSVGESFKALLAAPKPK